MIEYKNDRILEREENSLLSETKSENIKGVKSQMAWGKNKGQRWIYFSSSRRSPIRRFLSWLCKRTSFSYGKENWEILIADGSSTPLKWEQTGQQDRKFAPTPKYISTYQNRVGERTI